MGENKRFSDTITLEYAIKLAYFLKEGCGFESPQMNERIRLISHILGECFNHLAAG